MPSGDTHDMKLFAEIQQDPTVCVPKLVIPGAVTTLFSPVPESTSELRMISRGITFNLLYSLKRPLANLNDDVKKYANRP